MIKIRGKSVKEKDPFFDLYKKQEKDGFIFWGLEIGFIRQVEEDGEVYNEEGHFLLEGYCSKISKLSELEGQEIKISNGDSWGQEGGAQVTMYLYSHEIINNSIIKFIEVSDDAVILHWAGEAGDPIYYDQRAKDCLFEIEGEFKIARV